MPLLRPLMHPLQGSSPLANSHPESKGSKAHASTTRPCGKRPLSCTALRSKPKKPEAVKAAAPIMPPHIRLGDAVSAEQRQQQQQQPVSSARNSLVAGGPCTTSTPSLKQPVVRSPSNRRSFLLMSASFEPPPQQQQQQQLSVELQSLEQQSTVRVPSTRRSFLLMSTSLPWVLGAVGSNNGGIDVGSDDPTTLINSVLGAYFLPRMPGSQGFKLLDKFENAFTLEYPKSWVGRPNGQRAGLTIADYNSSDKLSVEILDMDLDPGPEEIVRLAVVSTIVPGFQQGQSDSKLELPASRFIKTSKKEIDGQAYTYLTFPSETTTRSGYDITRSNFAVAALRGKALFVCSASARSDQYDKEKEALLRYAIDSFRLR